MDTVIYSVTPLHAFSGNLLTALFFFVLGLVGAGWALFNKKEKGVARAAMGCASLVLLLAFIGTAVTTIWMMQSGEKTVVVHLNEKKIVKSNCNDGNTCTSYLLETQAGQKSYDFTVAKEAFDKAQENACYAVSYYPPQSLFGEYLQEDISEFYESAANITKIKKVGC